MKSQLTGAATLTALLPGSLCSAGCKLGDGGCAAADCVLRFRRSGLRAPASRRRRTSWLPAGLPPPPSGLRRFAAAGGAPAWRLAPARLRPPGSRAPGSAAPRGPLPSPAPRLRRAAPRPQPPPPGPSRRCPGAGSSRPRWPQSGRRPLAGGRSSAGVQQWGVGRKC
ncbi:hypothetical protein GUJ93_ZPchr0012g19053 [Zizania palustris]|uniref:Uncharacterized protein n=1 Tax=Zizania palustris TaxID=103762 RepID=A0A8J5WKP6_ZIZPA|nr:hypothetical protein GUJ93_ZPchr0012g19053 [Zizania palustris]